jgi:hypothetical protein
MKATRRASAPNSPHISIITEAPPGAMPHTAVVPGSTFSLAIIQPSAALVAMIAATTPTNSGQFRKNVTTMSPVMACATRQPIIVCAIVTGRRGTRIAPPFRASRIPASIGPSSSAAGKAANSSSAAKTAEPASSAVHCTGMESLSMGPGAREGDTGGVMFWLVVASARCAKRGLHADPT